MKKKNPFSTKKVRIITPTIILNQILKNQEPASVKQS